MSEERLKRLYEVVQDATSVLILPHNDPDPDAIASALALRYLLTEKAGLAVEIGYNGIIGRAENKALADYLGHPLRHVTYGDLHPPPPIALVDTQPDAGNNALPAESTPAIVIDHHQWQDASAAAPFVDVRPDVGATSTILTEYLRAAGLEPERRLATALFYGIKTDTMGLGRGTAPIDVDAYFYLQSRIDVEALVEIERAQVPADYFKRLAATLQAARVYDDVVVSQVGQMQRPDMAAEMADLLLRLQGARWVICAGVYKTDLILAVRTRSRRGGAGRLVQMIVGHRGTAGGHGTMAGAQIPLQGEDPEALSTQFIQRALEYLKVNSGEAGEPLI